MIACKEIRKITASNLFYIKTTPTAGTFMLYCPHYPSLNQFLPFSPRQKLSE
jgi:hypothetical protein